MLDPDRADWIAEIKRSIADLDRYRQRAEASGYYDAANRLKDQIGELDRRVKELQRAAS
jgi:transcription elongation GreA/GreB family factor